MPTSNRKVLADAIEANAEALAAVHKAENVLAAANERADLLQAKRTDFDDLDSQLATARANLVKAALNDEDNVRLSDTPQGFSSQLVARDAIEEQLAALRATIPTLENELEEARRAAARAEFDLDEARSAVFVADASALAEEFNRKVLEARHMAITLRHMTLCQVKRDPASFHADGQPYYARFGDTRQISMPKAVVEAVNEDIWGTFDLKNHPRVREKLAQEVAVWWAQLRTDPNAMLSEETKVGLFPSRYSDSAVASLRPTGSAAPPRPTSSAPSRRRTEKEPLSSCPNVTPMR